MLSERALPKEVSDDDEALDPTEEGGDDPDTFVADGDDEEDADPNDEVEGQDDGEDDEDGEEAGTSEQIEYLDAEDNLHVKMRVDGEEVEVPLNDLIQSYAGEKTAVKRLHEATDLRKKAQADYDKTVSEAQLIRDAAISIVKKLDEQLHTPAVPKPDEALKRTNPQRYLQHMDAYEQDQRRIAQSREMLQKAFEEHGNLTAQHREQRKAETAKAIIEAIPALQSQKTKQATMEKIFNAGKTYGFTDEEISALEDPRMYIMAYDAMRYREQTELGKQKPVKVEGKKKVLRAGKTRVGAKVRSQNRQVRTAKEKAATSGKPQDVADFLVARNLNKRK